MMISRGRLAAYMAVSMVVTLAGGGALVSQGYIAFSTFALALIGVSVTLYLLVITDMVARGKRVAKGAKKRRKALVHWLFE